MMHIARSRTEFISIRQAKGMKQGVWWFVLVSLRGTYLSPTDRVIMIEMLWRPNKASGPTVRPSAEVRHWMKEPRFTKTNITTITTCDRVS